VANTIAWGNPAGDLVGVDPGQVRGCLLGGGAAVGQQGNRAGDPRFLPDLDWHIGHGSAAVGAGDPGLAALPGEDAEGQARPVGRAPDAGADQQVVHTLVPEPRGMRTQRPFRLRAFTLPGATTLFYISTGVRQPGFPLPGLTGTLQLDFILALEWLGTVTADGAGVADLRAEIFQAPAMVGWRAGFQALGVRFTGGGGYEGGWTNPIVPGFLRP
jgi:hypothetical protein